MSKLTLTKLSVFLGAASDGMALSLRLGTIRRGETPVILTVEDMGSGFGGRLSAYKMGG
jgi:hypothetical protein